MQNFSEAFLHDAVLTGEIVLPGGDALEPWVDADDIADVAVAALTEPGHVGQLYELTSPRLYTMTDIAAELSRSRRARASGTCRCRPTNTPTQQPNRRPRRTRRVPHLPVLGGLRPQRPHRRRCATCPRPPRPRLRHVRRRRRSRRRLEPVRTDPRLTDVITHHNPKGTLHGSQDRTPRWRHRHHRPHVRPAVRLVGVGDPRHPPGRRRPTTSTPCSTSTGPSSTRRSSSRSWASRSCSAAPPSCSSAPVTTAAAWLLASATATYVDRRARRHDRPQRPAQRRPRSFDLAGIDRRRSRPRRDSYETPWNRWHHVRTIASVGSFALAAAAALVTADEA